MNNLSSFLAGVFVGGGAVLLLSPQSGVPTPWTVEEVESHSEEGLGHAADGSSAAMDISVVQRREPIVHEMIRDGSRNAL